MADYLDQIQSGKFCKRVITFDLKNKHPKNINHNAGEKPLRRPTIEKPGLREA